MADTYYGVSRPNWVSTTGVETLTSNMDFITIVTGVDIRPVTPVVVSQTGSTSGSSASVTVASTTGITVGMVVTGAGVVGNPIVASITSSTVVVLSVAQTLTSVALTFTGNNVACLNKLLEIVSERGQPVIMGLPTGVGPTTIILATEHKGWSSMQDAVFGTVSGQTLAARIAADGINFGFGTDSALSVTIGATLT